MLRETTHEAHTSLEGWLFLHSWERVSCLGGAQTHLTMGQPPEDHRAPPASEIPAWKTGPGDLLRVGGSFITLHFRDLFPFIDFSFLPLYFFSFLLPLLAFLPVFSLPVIMRSIVIDKVSQRPWVWPLVTSKVSFIHLCKFPQESNQTNLLWANDVSLCYHFLVAGANFLCPLYSWYIVCSDTVPGDDFRTVFLLTVNNEINTGYTRGMEGSLSKQLFSLSSIFITARCFLIPCTMKKLQKLGKRRLFVK